MYKKTLLWLFISNPRFFCRMGMAWETQTARYLTFFIHLFTFCLYLPVYVRACEYLCLFLCGWSFLTVYLFVSIHTTVNSFLCGNIVHSSLWIENVNVYSWKYTPTPTHICMHKINMHWNYIYVCLLYRWSIQTFAWVVWSLNEVDLEKRRMFPEVHSTPTEAIFKGANNEMTNTIVHIDSYKESKEEQVGE